MIVGDTVRIMKEEGKLVGGEIVGSRKDRVVVSAYNQGIISSSIIEREKANIEIENFRLNISDPKRRRTEKIKNIGPSGKGTPADIIMIETQTISEMDPKNVMLAGSVKETRRSL